MNYVELVQTIFTDADDDAAGSLLWNVTSFPFGVPKYGGDMDADNWYLHQLKEIHEASGGDITKAFEIADARVMEGMEEFRKKYPA